MDPGMLFVMVFVAMLGLSTGQTKNCCTPDQWQSFLNITFEKQWGPEYAVTYAYYDYTNRRSVYFGNFTDSSGQVSSGKALTLYSGPNSGILYYLDFKTRECSARKMLGPFTKFCVSDIAQKVGDFTLGAATESLPVTVYSITGQNTTSGTVITVTRDLCVPVILVGFTQGEEGISMTIAEYTEFRLGITQPSVFDVPPECKGARPSHPDKVIAMMTRVGSGEEGV